MFFIKAIRSLLLSASLGAALVACGGGSGSSTPAVANPPSATVTPSPIISPSPVTEPSPTPVSSPQPSPTATPSPVTTPTPSQTPVPTPTPTLSQCENPSATANISENEINVPENTLDGDLDTRWSAESGDGGAWLDIDCGGLAEISGVRIAFHRGDLRSAIFSIQASVDGQSWQTLIQSEQSSGDSLGKEYYDFGAEVQLRYFRFLGYGNSEENNDWNSVTEIDLVLAGEPIEDFIPADIIDLSYWKITLPLDNDANGSADEVDVDDIRNYEHPNFFYVDNDLNVVFAAPNKATTTANSSNTRSELRQMIRGTNTNISTSGAGNNFALAANPNASNFGAIGGKMSATLRVDHVALNADYKDKYPVHSMVVGQIHAGKDDGLTADGFGWGNEPLKIYFKKFPEHETGSVFWTYERNLAREDPDRTDIAYPVWGNTWENPSAPGAEGIALGETFSYAVNVYENTMYLTFSAEGKETIEYNIDLSDNVDAYGNVDSADFEEGYAGDWFYFKAGAYNQCNVNTEEGFWYTACGGTGVWSTDFANGDYVKATFFDITLEEAEVP